MQNKEDNVPFIKEKLIARRKECGFTKSALSIITAEKGKKVTEAALSLLESGKTSNPGLNDVEVLAKALGVSSMDFFIDKELID